MLSYLSYVLEYRFKYEVASNYGEFITRDTKSCIYEIVYEIKDDVLVNDDCNYLSTLSDHRI